MFVAAAIAASTTLFANTSENFNSRKGIPLRHLKSNLQNSCWTFHHFDINSTGWNPAIEGDGAMVSNPDALTSGNAGIYTPVLIVSDQISISFNYRFSEDFSSDENRWVKLCLADHNNNIVQVLEQTELNGNGAENIRKYSTKFQNIQPGEYRLLLLYGGSGGKAHIALDELTTSAPYKFPKGCNMAPQASDLIIKGEANRTAKGTLYPKSELGQKAFLVRNPEDGHVDLFPDGTFVFIPKKGFKGHNTTFIYRLCNDHGANLCSDPIKVDIRFPSDQLGTFHGSYKSQGNVELAWYTEPGNSIRSFEVERSVDGINWSSAGTIPANELHHSNAYTYVDKVGKNTALKKDLYYRLKHTDTEGAVNISKTMIVRVYNTRTLTMICVAPNPDKREITLNVQLPLPSMISVRVTDHSGKIAIYNTLHAQAGVNNIVVDGSRELPPGNYLLEVIVNSKERMLVKLIKEEN